MRNMQKLEKMSRRNSLKIKINSQKEKKIHYSTAAKNRKRAVEAITISSTAKARSNLKNQKTTHLQNKESGKYCEIWVTKYASSGIVNVFLKNSDNETISSTFSLSENTGKFWIRFALNLMENHTIIKFEDGKIR